MHFERPGGCLTKLARAADIVEIVPFMEILDCTETVETLDDTQ
jgi:hypothetical protein